MPSGGSNTLTVTITDEVASHTSAEIYAHVQSGGTAILDEGGQSYALSDWTEEICCFGSMSAEEGILYTWIVFQDGSCEFFTFACASMTALDEKLGKPLKAEVG